MAASAKFLYKKGQMFLFLADTRLSSWWELHKKMRCVIYPSSYGMSVFKGLYNEILAIKKMSGKTFGKSSECCLTEDRQKYALHGFS